MKIKELRPEQKNLNLIIRIEDLNEPREVATQLDDKIHEVSEALAGDETACVYLTLWDEKIGEIQKGNYYEISNAYTNQYRGSLRLNISKHGKIKAVKAEFKVNTANNLSLREIGGNTLL